MLAFRICLNGSAGVSACSGNDFDISCVEYLNSGGSDTSSNYHLRAVIAKKVWQKTGLMTGVGNRLSISDDSVFRYKKSKVLTVTKVFGNFRTFAGYCYFHVNVTFTNYFMTDKS